VQAGQNKLLLFPLHASHLVTNSVYIFGESSEGVTNEHFIERLIEQEEFIAKPIFYLANLIKGFIVNKK